MPVPLSPEGYAAAGGRVCPFCGTTGRFLTRGPLHAHRGAVVQRIACLACLARWRAVYELTGYEAEEEPGAGR